MHFPVSKKARYFGFFRLFSLKKIDSLKKKIVSNYLFILNLKKTFYKFKSILIVSNAYYMEKIINFIFITKITFFFLAFINFNINKNKILYFNNWLFPSM